MYFPPRKSEGIRCSLECDSVASIAQLVEHRALTSYGCGFESRLTHCFLVFKDR